VAASSRNCLGTAVDLERIDVSAALCRIYAGEVLGRWREVPALAWLPDELSKPDLLVRRLAVPMTYLRRIAMDLDAEVEAERRRAEYGSDSTGW